MNPLLGLLLLSMLDNNNQQGQQQQAGILGGGLVSNLLNQLTGITNLVKSDPKDGKLEFNKEALVNEVFGRVMTELEGGNGKYKIVRVEETNIGAE